MELSATFLGVPMDIPFHFNYGRSRRRILIIFFTDAHSNRINIRGRGWLTGFTDHHARPMNVQTDFFSKFQLVAQGKFHTVALITSYNQWLNPLTLNAIFDATRVMVPFGFPGLGIFGLFLTDFFNIVR